MIKRLIYRLIKFFFGVNIDELIDRNKSLESDLGAFEKENSQLKLQIELQKNQLLEKEEKFLAWNNEVETLQKEVIELKLNISEITSVIDAHKTENDELKQHNDEHRKEKETLKKQLQTEVEKQSSVQLLIAQKESALKEQSSLIENLQSQRKQVEGDKSEKQNEISNLKEQISQLQTDSVNTKLKEVELIDLKQQIEEKDSQIGNLKSELEKQQYKQDLSKPIESEQSDRKIEKVDGVVVYKGLNVGTRVKKDVETGNNDFIYLGKFPFDLKQHFYDDTKSFPDVFYPKLNTPVLKWNTVTFGTTTGVSEPLLAEAIGKLKEQAEDLQILQNISLSIRNRDYSYLPDLALFWEKYNICIDIEIDEPYDLVSRKPIHYIGSADFLRNLYFVSQGWVVIRFSEEQIVTKTDVCVKYIADILKKITEETVFDTLLENFILESTDRWDYKKAEELAENNFRESYLNIEAVKSILDQDADQIDNSPFKGNPPAEDILPKIDYSRFEKILNENKKRYIRITKSPFENQVILDDFKCKSQLYKKGISGFDVVEEVITFIPFEMIVNIDGLDSPFKYTLYNNPVNGNEEKLNSLVKEAIYGCYPIRMEYQDGNANITFRNITLISFEGDSKEYYCDNMWSKYYDSKSSMIFAYCLLREASRNFYIHRIQAIQIFDSKYLGLGHIISFQTGMWFPLKRNDLELCEHIANLIPDSMKETYLVIHGNYAHYLLFVGRKEEALEIYRKHDGKKVNEDLTWRQMNVSDFNELKTIEDYRDKIDEAIQLLGW